MGLVSEFGFTLPRGLIDQAGQVHRQGVMRLATAMDELSVERDRQAQQWPNYAVLVLLSRVITQLGDLTQLSPELLGNLFTQDVAYLREFYNRINQRNEVQIPTRCPACETEFAVDLTLAGE